MDAVIDREAGDKTKGLRFQKLRACIRLLTEINADPCKRMSCAIEFLEDSFLIDESNNLNASVEENKNYTSSLSFNSEPVRNTVVAFIDIDFRFLNDPSLKLCFFASAKLGDERFSKEILSAAGVDKKGLFSILKKLVEGADLSPDELAICKIVIVSEYKNQYKKRDGGYLEIIKKWHSDDWAKFLYRIDWSVCDEGNDVLEGQAINLIRLCHHFTHRHDGLESLILSDLLNIFEKRSESQQRVHRLVNASDVELIYLKALGKTSSDKPEDPAHRSWAAIENNDERNLSEKILAVCDKYPKSKQRRLNLRCALAKHEALPFGREYVSLRRRIYDVCDEMLADKCSVDNFRIDTAKLDVLLTDLVHVSVKKIEQLSASYNYKIQDEETIRGAVLSLFDECYLAFDSYEQE